MAYPYEKNHAIGKFDKLLGRKPHEFRWIERTSY